MTTTLATKTTDGAIVYARIQGYTLRHTCRGPAFGESLAGGWQLVAPDGSWRPFGSTKEAVAFLRAKARGAEARA